ncbi:MAG: hypothetical protein ACE5KH_03280 [Candidatus Geothermarchaeales archaeon]
MTGEGTLLRLEEVDQRIRDMSLLIFRKTPNFRVYFSNIYPHMNRTTQRFGVKDLWDEAYEASLIGDFEIDRVSLLLGTLYDRNRERFTELMAFIVDDARTNFHMQEQELDLILGELRKLDVNIE